MRTKEERRNLLLALLIAAAAVLLFRLSGIFTSYLATFVIALRAGNPETVEALFYEHYQLIVLVRSVLAFAFLVILAVLIGKPKETLGLRKIRPRSIPVVLLAGITLSFAVSAALTLIPIPEEIVEDYIETMETLTGGQPLLMGLNLVVLAPLTEEFAFRALAFRALRRAMPFWPASLLSALAFGITHTTVPQMIYAFVLGILFSAIDEKADSALPGFICHLGFNLLSFCFTLLTPAFELWQIVTWGALAAAVSAAAFILLFSSRSPLLSPKNTSEVSNDASL